MNNTDKEGQLADSNLFRNRSLLFALAWPGLTSIAMLYRGEACHTLGIFTVACLSQLIGGVILLCWLGFSGEKLSVPAAQRKELLSFTLLRCVLGEVLFVLGLGMSSGLNAVFVARTEPFLVLLWGYLFSKVSVTAGQFLLMALGFAAAVSFSAGGQSGLGGFQLGDVFIFLGLAAFSLTYRSGARLSKEIGTLKSVVFSQVIGGAALLPLVLWEVAQAGWSMSPVGTVYLVVAAILFNVFAVSLWLAALEGIPDWLVSALGAIGPLCAAPVAALVFNHTLTRSQIIAGTVVVLSSALLALSARKNGLRPERIKT